VTRCNQAGALVEAQDVEPITVPGGNTVMLPVVIVKPTSDGGTVAFSSLYGDPADPKWAARWAEYGPSALATVIPPTP
jgi:hypothetical protein